MSGTPKSNAALSIGRLMYSARSLVLCLLSILAALVAASEVRAVSMPPLVAGSQPSLPREATDEGVAVWNLLNPWSSEVADKYPSLLSENRTTQSESGTRNATAEDESGSDQENNNDPRRASFVLLADYLHAPSEASGTGTGTSGTSNVSSSWPALANDLLDLSPQIGIRLARERVAAYPIFHPNSVFHPPRR